MVMLLKGATTVPQGIDSKSSLVNGNGASLFIRLALDLRRLSCSLFQEYLFRGKDEILVYLRHLISEYCTLMREPTMALARCLIPMHI